MNWACALEERPNSTESQCLFLSIEFLSWFELRASFVKSEHKFAIAIENSSAQRLARHINFICCQLYLLFSHVFSCLHSFLFDLFAFLLSVICLLQCFIAFDTFFSSVSPVSSAPVHALGMKCERTGEPNQNGNVCQTVYKWYVSILQNKLNVKYVYDVQLAK